MIDKERVVVTEICRDTKLRRQRCEPFREVGLTGPLENIMITRKFRYFFSEQSFYDMAIHQR